MCDRAYNWLYFRAYRNCHTLQTLSAVCRKLTYLISWEEDETELVVYLNHSLENLKKNRPSRLHTGNCVHRNTQLKQRYREYQNSGVCGCGHHPCTLALSVNVLSFSSLLFLKSHNLLHLYYEVGHSFWQIQTLWSVKETTKCLLINDVLSCTCIIEMPADMKEYCLHLWVVLVFGSDPVPE